MSRFKKEKKYYKIYKHVVVADQMIYNYIYDILTRCDNIHGVFLLGWDHGDCISFDFVDNVAVSIQAGFIETHDDAFQQYFTIDKAQLYEVQLPNIKQMSMVTI